MQTMDKTLMGSFVHHQGARRSSRCSRSRRHPIFRVVPDFKACRAKYRAAMETKIQALLAGAAHQGAHEQEGPRARHEGWRDRARRVRVENTAHRRRPRRRGGVNE